MKTLFRRVFSKTITDPDALGMELFEAIEDSDLDRVKRLLKNKALNIEWVNARGDTALILAVRNKELKITEELLKAKAYINAVDRLYCTPLYLAVGADSLGLVNLLLSYKPDPSILPSFRPLTNNASVPICKALLSAISEHTMRQAVALANPEEVTENLSYVYGAADEDKLARADALAKTDNVAYHERHKKINKVDQLGMSALMWSAHFGMSETVEELVKKGATVDMLHPITSLNALYFAVKGGHKQVVKTLLLTGANPGIKTAQGSALKLAECKNNVSIKKYLAISHDTHLQLSQLFETYSNYLRSGGKDLQQFKADHPQQLFFECADLIDQSLSFLAKEAAASEERLQKASSAQKIVLYKTIVSQRFNSNNALKKAEIDIDEKEEDYNDQMSPRRSDFLIQELVTVIRRITRVEAELGLNRPSPAAHLHISTTRECLSPRSSKSPKLPRLPSSPGFFPTHGAELKSSGKRLSEELRALLHARSLSDKSLNTSATPSTSISTPDRSTSKSETVKPTDLFSRRTNSSSSPTIFKEKDSTQQNHSP